MNNTDTEKAAKAINEDVRELSDVQMEDISGGIGVRDSKESVLKWLKAQEDINGASLRA